MPKHRNSHGPGRTTLLVFLALAGLVLVLKVLLQGRNIALFNPKGLIAQEQHSLMITTVAIMLVIAIPAVFTAFFVAWKYRESNSRARYDPIVRHRRLLNASMWLAPSVFAVILATIMWPATHRLEPQKTIATDGRPLTIQVVSLRWKWLFIYPEQNIATVNFLQLPVNTPVEFELTADEAPMSSFWIPNLGGMLYTMTGMVNRLNLVADTPGDYPGSSAEISGAGFAGMKFTTRISSQTEFDQWVQAVKQTPYALDAAEYDKLLEPSENHLPAFYWATESGLYNKVVMKYLGPSGGHASTEKH